MYILDVTLKKVVEKRRVASNSIPVWESKRSVHIQYCYSSKYRFLQIASAGLSHCSMEPNLIYLIDDRIREERFRQVSRDAVRGIKNIRDWTTQSACTLYYRFIRQQRPHELYKNVYNLATDYMHGCIHILNGY